MVSNRVSVLLAVAMLASACGSEASRTQVAPTTTETLLLATTMPVTTETDQTSPPTLVVDFCEDDVCGPGFMLDGELFVDPCAGVAEYQVEDTIIARTDQGTIRSIEGIDPTILLAANFHALCGRTTESRWAIVVPPTGLQDDRYVRPLCDMGTLSSEYRKDFACDEVESETASAALEQMSQFVTLVRSGEIQAASLLWSGYPGPEDDLLPAFETFLKDFSWIVDDPDPPAMYVLPAYGWGSTPLPIVVLRSSTGTPEQVAAFLLGDRYEGEGTVIHRLPGLPSLSIDFAHGSTVRAGQQLDFGFVPVEGHLRAFINDQEIDQITVDHNTFTTTIVLPDSLEPGPAVLTISAATPEYPGSFAIGLTIIK